MKSCEPKIPRLLAEQPGYQQAVANFKNDYFPTGNPSALRLTSQSLSSKR